MKKLFVALMMVSALVFTSCTNESGARQTLENHGFTNIVTTGWSPFSCDEKDFSSTGFTATNPVGKRVSGVVCCGMIFKNCTVRF